jgi:hypothetical protein
LGESIFEHMNWSFTTKNFIFVFASTVFNKMMACFAIVGQ